MNKVEKAIKRFRSTPQNDRMFLEAEAELRLSERMIELRHKAGLTQKKLADRLGVSQAYVGKLESGGYDRSGIGTLRGVALALGHDIALETMFVPQNSIRYAARDVERNIILHAADHSEHILSRTVVDLAKYKERRVAVG
jgi:transcriptional regulator with XRE-family HTH domain